MKLTILLWFVVVMTSAHSQTRAQNSFTLRSLIDASVRSVDLNNLKKRTLFLIFQSDCPACQLQVRDLQCLKSKYDVILIGAYSSEKLLRQEYRRMGQPYESFLGEGAFLKALKAQQGLTPELIILSQNKGRHILGLTPCAEISL